MNRKVEMNSCLIFLMAIFLAEDIENENLISTLSSKI